MESQSIAPGWFKKQHFCNNSCPSSSILPVPSQPDLANERNMPLLQDQHRTARRTALRRLCLVDLSFALTNLNRALHRIRSILQPAAFLGLETPEVHRAHMHCLRMCWTLFSAINDLRPYLENRDWQEYDDLWTRPGEDPLDEAMGNAAKGIGLAMDSCVQWWLGEDGVWMRVGWYEWWPYVEALRSEWEMHCAEFERPRNAVTENVDGVDEVWHDAPELPPNEV